VGFSDVNPPVHAWAAWRVYKIEKRIRGTADIKFLTRIFPTLLHLVVNPKDAQGKNVFHGSFLGLDNIGVFDRSAPLHDRRHHRAVGWHGVDRHVPRPYAGDRALARVSRSRPYESVGSKFFEHFVYIAPRGEASPAEPE